MAGSLNKVMLIGNVGRDPEMRYTQSGEPVTTFSIATNRRVRGTADGQFQDETEWHNIVAWGKLAEQCNEYLTKGRKVFVEGRLQTRSWDGQDGQKRFRTEIVANTMLMLDQRPRDDGGSFGGGSGSGYGDRDRDRERVGSAVGESGDNTIDLDDTPF
jgi:single-strand DNA-binding protein